MADEPIIAWDNNLVAANYAFFTGKESNANPLSNAATKDILRIATPLTDSTGKVVVEYAMDAVADTLIVGAARHITGGYRFSGGSVKLEAMTAGGWSSILDTAIGATFKQSELFKPTAHTATIPAGWTTVAGGASVRGSVFGNGKWVLAGSSNVYTSSDNGLTWSTVAVGAVQFNSVAWDGTTFVMVGDTGNVYTSTDAIAWTSRTSGVAANLNGVAWSGLEFVAVGAGSGTMITSSDGITWVDNTATSGTTNTLNSVTHDGLLFIAVGAAGTIITTSDGITGTARTSGTANALNDIAKGELLLNAVGDAGTIIFSYDGVTWTTATSGTANALQAIASNGDVFKAVGSNALIESSDGLAWTVGTPISALVHYTIGFNEVVWLTDSTTNTYYFAGRYRYRLTFSGLTVTAEVSIPELFLGPRLTMPNVNFGYDPYNEVSDANTFQTEKGRQYNDVLFKRVELTPKWSILKPAEWAAVDLFREGAIEPRSPWWWAWKPDTAPTECYLVRHEADSAKMPIIESASDNLLRSFTSLKLGEAI